MLSKAQDSHPTITKLQLTLGLLLVWERGSHMISLQPSECYLWLLDSEWLVQSSWSIAQDVFFQCLFGLAGLKHLSVR